MTSSPQPEEEGGRMDLLFRVPDTGQDTELERALNYGRPVVELY